MAASAYYNEIDPYAAAWLRNLIAAGHIAPGDVDERSIEDVEPAELARYTQCHFFAGIGVWSHALRLAGWPDDRPVWTGSCPCQPFSAAGKGAGFADERHLWPAFHWLIEQCRPPVVFGEQVASADGLAWLDLVQTDLEGTGYASAAVDLCAAGVGAPHIRQRLYWVANADRQRRTRQHALLRGEETGRLPSDFPKASWGSEDGGLANNNKRLEGRRQPERECGTERAFGPSGMAGGVADADSGQRNGFANGEGCERNGAQAGWQQGNGEPERSGKDSRPRPTDGFWRNADWLACRDGKWRPVEPGTFPLAHGATARVGRLRAYGNAIVPQVAQAFIQAYMTR